MSTIREAEAVAREVDASLKATDPRFSGVVKLVLDDGSDFFWDSAFCEYREVGSKTWLMVFTEHHLFHVYDDEDVLSVRAWSGLGHVQGEKMR